MDIRYVEISRRNPVTRIFVGSGSNCTALPSNFCGNLVMSIRRAGQYKCQPPVRYDSCCKPEPVPACDFHVIDVPMLEIDEEGYAVFEWPPELYELKQGWYIGELFSDCNKCGEIPVRIGPRCNVLEVEKVVVGPDSACWVGCEDDCTDDICNPKSQNPSNVNFYYPSYLRG